MVIKNRVYLPNFFKYNITMEVKLKLGLNVKGNFIRMVEISEDDFDKYDYICQVIQSYSNNGNGTYSTIIQGNDYSRGMSLGNWKLSDLIFRYNWNEFFYSMTIVDEYGNESTISPKERSPRGVSLYFLVDAAFQRFSDIVSKFPSLDICEKFDKFDVAYKNFSPKLLTSIKEKDIDSTISEAEKLNNILSLYNDLCDSLNELDEEIDEDDVETQNKVDEILSNVESKGEKILESVLERK